MKFMNYSRSIAEVAESESDEANRMSAEYFADYYKQIAEWLKELKERRELPEIIHCGECRFREIRGVDGFCDHITGEPIMVKKTDYCVWGGRRTDG